MAKIVKHPSYEKTSVYKEDIALMIPEGSLQFSDTIKPICLFQSQTPITSHVDQWFFVLGFGSNSNSRNPSRKLMYGRMSVISHHDCSALYRRFINLSQDSAFCAKSVDNVLACKGDSGGELIACTKEPLFDGFLLFRWLSHLGKRKFLPTRSH